MDKWAIIPTKIRIQFISKPQKKRVRLEWHVNRALEKMDWNRPNPVKRVEGAAGGTVLVDGEDLRKSWTCKMQ